MKVEYLHKGALDCPLIRIMDFSREELRALRRVFVRLARGSEQSVSIGSLSRVDCIDGIDLLLQDTVKDEGIELRHRIGNTFHCRLSRDAWLEANGKAKRIEQAIGAGSFNWLNDDGDVRLLLSWNGGW